MRLIKRDFLLNEVYQSAIVYSAPAGLTYLWNFGSMALASLIIQIFTGIFLAMFYTNSVFFAFDSIEHIMRDVPFGWLIRYIHANGASMFFLAVYLHLCRGLFFSSFYTPRYKLWISGVLILFLMMGTAFMGYVLPWGQMSFWAATVITNLASAIPYYGNEIVFWFWGAFSVDVPTLGRFFSLHYLLPFVLVGLVGIHLIILHESKSGDGLGLNILSIDRVPFGIYYIIKDIYGYIFYAMLFSFLVFFYPNLLGHSDNYIEANPMVTPAHIVPEWYFLPFYAILRAIPDKLYGVILMIFSIVFIGLFPFFLHLAKRTNFIPQAGFHRVFFRRILVRFVICFILLGWLGGQPASGIYITLGIKFTILFFFILTINLYFVLLKEMFIYSNHHLVFSKIIQEDEPHYYNDDYIETKFSDIDECEYFPYDFIKMYIYEYEPYEMLSIEGTETGYDKVVYNVNYDSKRMGFESLKDLTDKEYEQYFAPDHIDYFNGDVFINDAQFNFDDQDPFSLILVRNAFECQYFAENASDFRPFFEDEDMEKRQIFFPSDKKVYILDETCYSFDDEHDNDEEQDGDICFIIPIEWELDEDDIEYWNHTIFSSTHIRESHYFKFKEYWYTRSFFSPDTTQWSDVSITGQHIERY